MNLYLINNSDSAIVYGIGSYLKGLSNALKGAGIKVHILYLHSIRKKFEIEKFENIENWYIPDVRYENSSMSNPQKIDTYCRNVLYLLRLYIKEDERELVFHFNNNYCKQLAKDLKLTFNCRTVVAIHYSTWMLELQGNMQRLHKIKSKPENERNSFELRIYESYEYEKALFNEADHVIALSQHMQRILETEYQLSSDKISVIPNGLADSSATHFSGKHELRKKWQISCNEFIVLFVGRLHSVKGLTFLISAFRKLLGIFPDCRLIIVGNGNYDIYLQESKDICMKMNFTGQLGKKELFELYQISDIGVMPSFHEQCSYVAIEMMMHALPIISSTSTGLKEMIEDGVSGLHVPVIEYEDKTEVDSDLLAEKMLYLLQNSKERQRIGQNARKRYEVHYSMELFRKNMLNFYQSL